MFIEMSDKLQFVGHVGQASITGTGSRRQHIDKLKFVGQDTQLSEDCFRLHASAFETL